MEEQIREKIDKYVKSFREKIKLVATYNVKDKHLHKIVIRNKTITITMNGVKKIYECDFYIYKDIFERLQLKSHEQVVFLAFLNQESFYIQNEIARKYYNDNLKLYYDIKTGKFISDDLKVKTLENIPYFNFRKYKITKEELNKVLLINNKYYVCLNKKELISVRNEKGKPLIKLKTHLEEIFKNSKTFKTSYHGFITIENDFAKIYDIKNGKIIQKEIFYNPEFSELSEIEIKISCEEIPNIKYDDKVFVLYEKGILVKNFNLNRGNNVYNIVEGFNIINGKKIFSNKKFDSEKKIKLINRNQIIHPKDVKFNIRYKNKYFKEFKKPVLITDKELIVLKDENEPLLNKKHLNKKIPEEILIELRKKEETFWLKELL